MKLDARTRLVLGGILTLAFTLRMAAALELPNVIWPDEIFQTLEQAHRVAFGEGAIPWEFREGTRSWIVPGVLAAVMKASTLAGPSPGIYLTACWVVLVLSSLLAVWACARTSAARGDLRGAVLGAVMATVWFELVYFAPKALNEVIAGNLFALGLAIVESNRRALRHLPRRDALSIAASLTGALLLRVQLGPAAAIVLAVVFVRAPAMRAAIAITSTALVAIYGVVDLATWDYPFQSIAENFRINIMENKAAEFGTAAWYAYFEVFARLWGGWSILVLALATVGARRAPLTAIAAAVVVLTHALIMHKEYRFAYPALVLVVMLAAGGAADLVELVRTRFTARWASLAAVLCAALWCSASLYGAAHYHQSKTTISGQHGTLTYHWRAGRGGLLGMRKIGEAPDTCGVGLVRVYLFQTGGYTYLHRDVPILQLSTPAELSEGEPHVNALLASPRLPRVLGPFKRVECWVDACVYRRDGGCQPLPDYDLNALLRAAGQ